MVKKKETYLIVIFKFSFFSIFFFFSFQAIVNTRFNNHYFVSCDENGVGEKLYFQINSYWEKKILGCKFLIFDFFFIFNRKIFNHQLIFLSKVTNAGYVAASPSVFF